MPSFKQLESEQAELGLIHIGGYLALSPSQLHTRLGIEFKREKDDMGEMEVALIESCEGRQFGLFRYLDSPKVDHTAIMIHKDCEDVNLVLNDVMLSLGIGSDEFLSFDPKFTFESHTLWRQDDNGNRINVESFNCQADAEIKLKNLEKGGHKQTYWIEKE